MKNITLATSTAIAGLLAFSAVSAEASSFTYNFNSPVGDPISSPQVFTATPSGPNLTVTGFKDLPTLTPGDFSISANQGLGVSGPPSAGNTGKDINDSEAVELKFPGSTAFGLHSITFSAMSSNVDSRDVSISVDGGTAITYRVPGTDPTVTVPASDLGIGSGNTFLLHPDSTRDLFRIRSADFAVPEPLTILGTGFALASMPVLKKAQKQKSK